MERPLIFFPRNEFGRDATQKIVKNSTNFINKTNKTKMGKIKLQNRLERQNGAADQFFDSTKNSWRWILKVNRPKNFQNLTIFTYRPEMA